MRSLHYSLIMWLLTARFLIFSRLPPFSHLLPPLAMPGGTPSLLDKANRSGQAQNCGVWWHAPKRPSPIGLVPCELNLVFLTLHRPMISYHVYPTQNPA